MLQGSLQGITVLDLSRLLPGPFASMMLADHGARVIGIEGVETMGGDLVSTPLPTLYRNKEQMRIDLKKDEGRELFLRLVRKADVILEGFRPGVVNRLGIDYETVRGINPRIVYCSLTGYGQTGPRSERTGHDINFMAESGYLFLSAVPGSTPPLPPTQIADHSGGLYAALGIMMALFSRERTGTGQYVDVSIADSLISLLTVPLTLHGWKLPAHAGGSILGGALACYNVYETLDKRHVAVGALEPRFFRNLCEALDAPDLIPFHYDLNRQGELKKRLADIFAGRTSLEWYQVLEGLDACTTVVATLDETMQDEQYGNRGMISREDSGFLLGIPVKLSASPGSIRTPRAERGAHTRAILQENGLAEEIIDDLFSRGIVG